MKKTLSTILLGASLFFGAGNKTNGQSKVQNIDVSEKVINFASYCKSGKITIFEISTPGCKPCESLKKWLLDKDYDANKVDIYYCVLGSGQARRMWGYCEGITAVPVVYFFGPAKNPVKILHATDENYNIKNIDRIINGLIESLNDYKEDLVDFKKKTEK